MRNNLKGSIPFEFIYSEAESSSEDEPVEKPISCPSVSHPTKLTDSDEEGIYTTLSEESVNSDQSMTSEPSYFSVESDSSTVENIGFLESSESSKIDLERDFEKSSGQDFDKSQEAPQSKDHKSLPNRLTTNKFSILSTVYDKPCIGNENSMEMENSIQLFCTNPGCREVFACEEDLRNHLLSQYNPTKCRNVISQQSNSNIVDTNANKLDSYKRFERNKHMRNEQKNDSCNRQRCSVNFLTRNIHRNSPNTTRDELQHGKYFTSGSHLNGYDVYNHSESSEDNNNKHFIFRGQTYNHDSSDNVLKTYSNRFQPIRYDKQKCKNKEFTTGPINNLDPRYIREEKGYDQKFRTEKELKNQVSYNCKEHRFKQRFIYESGRTIHLTKDHPRISKVYNRRFTQDATEKP
ncbi:17036_t:CDS:2 [Dentiscutata heterogama]|uniref:17036_t:CDS:1 n=1 Tax=Dentiscutata heterogama TaxID=1316150 RepID=A0ACA9KNE3_9GLOM|nr:17036_t:CDS:2 [Dentiscutata heterogama]